MSQWRIEFLECVRVTFEVEVVKVWKHEAGTQTEDASQETGDFRKILGQMVCQT